MKTAGQVVSDDELDSIDSEKTSVSENAPSGTRSPGTPSERSSIAQSITKLAGGKSFAIGVGLLTTPLLARLYGPESFGVVAILIAFVTTLKPVVCMAYESAIPLSSSSEERRALLALSAGITFVLTILLTLCAVLGEYLLAPALAQRGLAGYLFFIPVFFVASALTVVGNMCLGCERRFGQVAIRDVLNSVGVRFSRIGLGFTVLGNTPLGLLLGTTAGMFVAAFVFPFKIAKDILLAPEERLKWRDLREAAQKHSKFPKYTMTGTLFNALSVNFPVYVLGFFFPISVAGTYSVVHRLLQLPRDLFANAAGKAFYIDAAEQQVRGESVTRLTRQLITVVLALTAMPFTTIFLLAPSIFGLLLGAAWQDAGLYAQILTPVLAASALSSPLSSLFLTKGEQARGLAFNALLVVIRLTALCLGAIIAGPEITLTFYAVGSVCVYILVIRKLLRFARVSGKWMTLSVLRSYGEAFLWILPAAVMQLVLQNSILTISVAAVAVLGYAVLTLKRHPELAAPIFRIPILKRFSIRFGLGQHVT